LPSASAMLCNYLRTEIRGTYPQATSLKIYNMGLHMHSTKTCCAPCEYTLLGLMNDRVGLVQNGQRRSFLHNFEDTCSLPNEKLSFVLPTNSPFRLLVTVTANDPDADHKKAPTLIETLAHTSAIAVKSAQASEKIHMTLFTLKHDQRRIPNVTNLTDKTVGISGSKATPGSSGTMRKVVNTRTDEQISLIDSFIKLSI
ncbi:MAG: hypothetical protein V4487_03295, partial [Chlamydiota bacterium]